MAAPEDLLSAEEAVARYGFSTFFCKVWILAFSVALGRVQQHISLKAMGGPCANLHSRVLS